MPRVPSGATGELAPRECVDSRGELASIILVPGHRLILTLNSEDLNRRTEKLEVIHGSHDDGKKAERAAHIRSSAT